MYIIPDGEQIPAVLLTHNTYGALVPFSQSVNFVDTLKQKGAQMVKLFPVLYGPHNCHISSMTTYEEDMLRIASFVKRHL